MSDVFVDPKVPSASDAVDPASPRPSLRKPTRPCGQKQSVALGGLVFGILGGVVAGYSVAMIVQTVPHAKTVPIKQANMIVEKLTHDKAHVIRVFPGPKGLTGMVVSGAQGPIISWMTSTRSAVIVGGVVDAKSNQNLTMRATVQYIAAHGVMAPSAGHSSEKTVAPDPVPVDVVHATHANALSGEAALQAFLKGSRNGDFVQVSQQGLSGPHTLYAFVDPNCIFCHKLFDYVQLHHAEFQKAGVRVVYVPVAILKQSSIAKAAEMAKEGWPALLRDEQKFNGNDEEGGLNGLSDAELAHYAAPIHVNTRWLQQLSTANHANEGTPFLVWQAGNGRAYYMDGFPTESGVQKLLASMQDGWAPQAVKP